MIYIDYSSYANNFMKREAKCKFYMDDNNFMKREAKCKFYMDDNFGPLRFIAVAKVAHKEVQIWLPSPLPLTGLVNIWLVDRIYQTHLIG